MTPTDKYQMHLACVEAEAQQVYGVACRNKIDPAITMPLYGAIDRLTGIKEPTLEHLHAARKFLTELMREANPRIH